MAYMFCIEYVFYASAFLNLFDGTSVICSLGQLFKILSI